MRTREFLTAEWLRLAMLNYEVDPAILRPFAPRGAELDTWNNRQFVDCLSAKPASAFVADGSAIVVRKGARL